MKNMKPNGNYIQTTNQTFCCTPEKTSQNHPERQLDEPA
jgi:hypothetical protein